MGANEDFEKRITKLETQMFIVLEMLTRICADLNKEMLSNMPEEIKNRKLAEIKEFTDQYNLKPTIGNPYKNEP